MNLIIILKSNYILNNPANVKAQRRKLKRLVHKCKRGQVSKDRVDASFDGWRNHASKGNSYQLIQKMNLYYKNLWEDII